MMHSKMMHSKRRHLAKAVSWRVVGSIDTTLLGWIITGNPLTGLRISFAETFTKFILYYFHERAWFNVNLDRFTGLRNSHRRHAAKAITWRALGTVDTMILAWIISGNPMIGLEAGAADTVTKMMLYYIHEEIWHRSKFGLVVVKEADEAEEILS